MVNDETLAFNVSRLYIEYIFINIFKMYRCFIKVSPKLLIIF